MTRLKLVQKNCDTDIERDGWGNLKRETCILHRLRLGGAVLTQPPARCNGIAQSIGRT